MGGLDKVKVTHTLTRHTRDRVRDLVRQGEVRDASAFIEQAVEAALHEYKMRNLALELEAFEDDEYAAHIAQMGDDGLEDLRTELSKRV